MKAIEDKASKPEADKARDSS